MKDIFTDLYNKVLGFFRQTEKVQEEENTKDVACNRLKFVLMQDRTNLSPELMDRMRKELVELLSKYVEMDKEALELGFEQEGSQMALMLSIPVVRAKEEAEIEAILAKEDEEKSAKSSEDDAVSESEDEIADKSDEVDEESSDDEVVSDDNLDVELSSEDDVIEVSDSVIVDAEEDLSSASKVVENKVKEKVKAAK